MNEMYPVYKGMLDPIIISYKLTIYLCVTNLEYNNTLWIQHAISLMSIKFLKKPMTYLEHMEWSHAKTFPPIWKDQIVEVHKQAMVTLEGMAEHRFSNVC